MANANLVVGDDTANSLSGGAGRDVIYGFDPDGPQGTVSSIAATRVAAGVNQPVFATAAPGDPDRLFVVEKTGAIKIVDLATKQVLPTPFLDLSAIVSSAGESGLLGLAFDPGFATNGLFYVNLINTAGDTEVRRYHATGADQADPASALVLLTVDQPAGRTNHKAGWLGFGPDEDLYVALGDGGGSGDPDGNGQNLNTLLGKMLRIDPHADAFPADPARNYAIPADNPFVGAAGLDEIWALGLRNPWRSSFDRAMGDFYIADVGQGQWEEIDLGASGANYGWNVFEGPDVYAGGTPTGGSAVAPIHFYDHDVGRSITGGYVYRGESEGLQGDYIFADFVTSKIFSLDFDGSAWARTDRTGQLVADIGSVGSPSSFGEDGRGNLYVVDIGGEIFRLTPVTTSADVGDQLRGNGGDDVLYGGSGNDALYGGADDDVLYGGEGADTLAGEAGADLMIGGPGDDTYVVDATGDLVIEDAGEGRDTVFSSLATVTLAANVDVLRLVNPGTTGIGNGLANTLYGTAGVDTLIGGAGNDVMIGNAGADRMTGGPGDDVYYVDAGDTVTEVSGGGADTVYTSLDLRLADGAEILRLQGAAHTGTGNHADNVIYGGPGDDLLNGIGGRDTILGGGGRDMFALTNLAYVRDYFHDFVPLDDTIVIDDTGFGFTRSGSTLASNGIAFVNGAQPTGAVPTLFYSSGHLAWDSDGTGAAGAVVIADFNGAPTLRVDDFLIA